MSNHCYRNLGQICIFEFVVRGWVCQLLGSPHGHTFLRKFQHVRCRRWTDHRTGWHIYEKNKMVRNRCNMNSDNNTLSPPCCKHRLHAPGYPWSLSHWLLIKFLYLHSSGWAPMIASIFQWPQQRCDMNMLYSWSLPCKRLLVAFRRTPCTCVIVVKLLTVPMPCGANVLCLCWLLGAI